MDGEKIEFAELAFWKFNFNFFQQVATLQLAWIEGEKINVLKEPFNFTLVSKLHSFAQTKQLAIGNWIHEIWSEN